jgi:hypothetical protein
MKKEGLVLVEMLTPSEMEKEMASRAGSDNVEAPAPNDREKKPYQITLKTSAHKEGTVVVVEE